MSIQCVYRTGCFQSAECQRAGYCLAPAVGNEAIPPLEIDTTEQGATQRDFAALREQLAKVTTQLEGARKDRDNAVMDWQAQVERLSQQLATAIRERDEARAKSHSHLRIITQQEVRDMKGETE